jgi:hypothetical protein
MNLESLEGPKILSKIEKDQAPPSTPIVFKQKWIFLIGLGLIVLDFPFISGKLTDKSNGFH